MKFPGAFFLAERTGLSLSFSFLSFIFFSFSEGNFEDGTATSVLRNGSNDELGVLS